jgi:uncharacterized protein
MKLLLIPFQKAIYGVLASLAVLSFTASSLAVTVEQVPNPREVNNSWVTDMADILSPTTETQLNQIISQLEAKNGSEIAVVTVPETTASTPKEFATKLFNRWGIGKADKNNGVLLLISQGDRRTEIETGSGIQEILPNAKVSDIINSQITPKFKQGDFNGGTLAGTKALVVAQQTPQSTPKVTDSVTLPPAIVEQYKEDNNILWWLLGGAGLVLAAGVVGRNNTKPQKQSRSHNRKNAFDGSNHGTSVVESSSSDSSSYTSSSDSGSSYTSSSDSGGGSFGGGSSDGGGAGGSW